jgi:hypothetical protein
MDSFRSWISCDDIEDVLRFKPELQVLLAEAAEGKLCTSNSPGPPEPTRGSNLTILNFTDFHLPDGSPHRIDGYVANCSAAHPPNFF